MKGLIIREPNPDEYGWIRDYLQDQGWGYPLARVNPGGDHSCAFTKGVKNSLAAELHRRRVTFENVAVCSVCDQMIVQFVDVPYTVDPGFFQRRVIRSMVSVAQLQQYPFAPLSRDGRALPHECPPPRVKGCDTECGEGEGRDQ